MGGTPNPFHCYFYRIWTIQGERPHGGAKEYVVSGAMTRGFAILAYPADYGNSGVMSFLSTRMALYSKRISGKTPSDAAKAITTFSPDDDWKPVE